MRSKISVSLARSGIRNMLLVDDDVFLPHNIQRHELDYNCIGHMKVDALSKRLGKISSDIIVETSKIGISTLESNEAYNKLIEKISDCDMIIDATANNDAFYVLANISILRNKPMVWGQVYAGGLGGLVAKNNVNMGISAFHVQESIKSFYLDNPHKAHENTRNYEQRIGDEVFVASDADVSIVTSWMTKMIFSILEPENKAVQFVSNAYFIGCKKEWIFQQPMQVVALDVNVDMFEKETEFTTKAEKNNIEEEAQRIIDEITGDKNAEINNTK